MDMDVPMCLAANKGSYCYYYYDSASNFKTRCYCAGDGSIGYCPLPNRAAMLNFTKYESFIQGNATNCHTFDRNNLKAQVECGIGQGNALQVYTEAKVVKEQWGFVQDEGVKECLMQQTPGSYQNLLKAGGVWLIVGVAAGMVSAGVVMW